MSKNVIPFRAPDIEGGKALEHDKAGGTVIRAFSALPEKRLPFSEIWAKRKESWQQAAIVQPYTPPAYAPEVAPIQPKAEIAPRDISEDMQDLPPIDGVTRVLPMLVPAECLTAQGFPDFLNASSRMEGNASRVQEIPEEALGPHAGQHVEDAKTMTGTQLRKKYGPTYSVWQNMKGRRKEGKKVHPKFEKFADFLIEVGPRPSPDHSIDRIDNDDLEYAPGNVRWLDSKGQANNRSTTRMLEYRGEKKPTSVWADEFRQNRSTVLNRIDKLGWTVEEALTGHRAGAVTYDLKPWNYHADPEMRQTAEDYYVKYGRLGETPIRFCLRRFREGLGPWEEHLRDMGTGDEGKPFGPELEQAMKTLCDLDKPRRWLEKVQADLDTAKMAAAAKLKKKQQMRSRTRRIDPEVADQNYHENLPELAYRDDPDPVEGAH